MSSQPHSNPAPSQSQQTVQQQPLNLSRRKTVVERLASAFSKATARVSRQVRAGLAPQGPLVLSIPPNLPALTKQSRKSQGKTLTTRDAIQSPFSTSVGSNYSQWATEALPIFRASAISQGAGFFAPSKEDRIVFIDDLYEHVHTNYPRYDVDKFGDTMPLSPAEHFIIPSELDEPTNGEDAPLSDFPIISNFKLFAVFDGHCGQFASTFLQYRFPFELCGNASFKKGLYEQALAESFQSAHAELLKAQKYAPEAPNNDFSSGATASVVFVTPTRTFFAAVGDSPILVWRRGTPYPDILFKEHDAENKHIHERLVESNVFLVLVREVAVEGYYQREVATQNVYYLVTSKGIKQKVLSQAAAAAEAEKALKESEQKQIEMLQKQHDSINPEEEDIEQDEESLDQRSPVEAEQPQQIEEDIPFSDLRIGFSALNVFGTLGDSLYDMEVFNTLIDELVAFREDRLARYTKTMQRLQEQERTGVVVEPSGVIMGPELEDTLASDLLLSTTAAAAAVAAYSNPAVAAGAMLPEDPEKKEEKSKRKDSDKKKKRGIKWMDKDKANSNPNIAKIDDHPQSLTEEISESEPDPEASSSSVNAEVPTEKINEEQKLNGNASEVIVMPPVQPQARKLSEIPSILFPFELYNSLQDLAQVDPAEFAYSEFRWWIMSRPKWEFMRKHLSLLKKEAHMSRVLLAALRNLNASHRLTSAGLLRVPETTSIPNRDLALFVVASDGVIRFYEKFKDEFRGMVTRNSEDPERITELLKDYMKWLRDDRSVIVCRYGFGTTPLFKDPEIPVAVEQSEDSHEDMNISMPHSHPHKRPTTFMSSAFSAFAKGNAGSKPPPAPTTFADKVDNEKPVEKQEKDECDDKEELPRDESENTLQDTSDEGHAHGTRHVGRFAKMIKIIR